MAAELMRVLRGQWRSVGAVVLLGLVVNAALCLAKGAAGLYFDSAILLAEASHSFSDIFADIVALIALGKVARGPTPAYPFGHGKLDTMGSAAIAAMLLASSVGVGIHALSGLHAHLPALLHSPSASGRLADTVAWVTHMGHHHSHEAPTGMDPHVLGLVVLNAGVKTVLAHITQQVARESHSALLEASVHHYRVEILGSFGAFIAMLGAWTGFSMLDPLGGLVLATINATEAFPLLWRSLQQLCDHSADEPTLARIRHALDAAVEETKLGGAAHATVPVRWSMLASVPSGPAVMVDVALQFPPATPLRDACAYADAIEQQMKKREALVRMRVMEPP
ncbi:hypothetical protein MSPP1_000276 [Malassezia sp. CBS 17886]|nr:hypothetical protein MSPP1_000276 [Malassezia sp. CBS 17886]